LVHVWREGLALVTAERDALLPVVRAAVARKGAMDAINLPLADWVALPVAEKEGHVHALRDGDRDLDAAVDALPEWVKRLPAEQAEG
jgi:hypothetical protein